MDVLGQSGGNNIYRPASNCWKNSAAAGNGFAAHFCGAPHHSNRKKPKTQDGRRLRRYDRRWIVERFFAWLQWQRRFITRWEYYSINFLGFVQLAAIVILLKRF